jgi:hypothetical protein
MLTTVSMLKLFRIPSSTLSKRSTNPEALAAFDLEIPVVVVVVVAAK